MYMEQWEGSGRGGDTRAVYCDGTHEHEHVAHMRRMMCPVWTTSNAKYIGTQFTKSSYTMCSVAPISYSIMRTNGTIGVDLLAHTALRCHVSVMLLCRFAFQRFLLLTKTKNVT